MGDKTEARSMTDKTINTLLVIGNGFDKHCKLASTFSEYYEKRCLNVMKGLYLCYSKGDLYTAKEIFSSNKDKDVINFWSFLFYVHYYTDNRYRIVGVKNKNWFDIEQLICDVLTKNLSSELKIAEYVDRALKALKTGRSYFRSEDESIRAVPYCFLPFVQETTATDAYEYLMEELHKFEKSFKGYMICIIDEDYQDRCNDFLETLLGEIDYADLINFNYTTIDRTCLINRQTNVHGKLFGDEIIIGIDSSSVHSDDLIRFTKTYRNIHRVKKDFILPETVGYIIFYGHSLADADFSYFQSLFDMYHLYDGKLKLTFYYSDYCYTEAENEAKHAEYVHHVYQLINKYSEKTRKDRNLLHRLLLEGRITIQKI